MATVTTRMQRTNTGYIPWLDPAFVPHLFDQLSEFATEIAELGAQKTADIIDEETHGVGRLAAGIGKYDSSRLKGDSESVESDAYFLKEDKGNVLLREYGTNVPYAAAVDLGYEVTNPRRVLLPNGRWVYIKPQTFGGRHFFDRGLSALISSGEMNARFKARMDNVAAAWKNK